MLQKLTQEQLQSLLQAFRDAALAIPALKIREIILFGSYARGDANEESDVDIMILTDLPREQIPDHRQELVRISTNLGWTYAPVVSPAMQNYDFFMNWVNDLPFYRNVEKEGVRIYAA